MLGENVFGDQRLTDRIRLTVLPWIQAQIVILILSQFGGIHTDDRLEFGITRQAD